MGKGILTMTKLSDRIDALESAMDRVSAARAVHEFAILHLLHDLANRAVDKELMMRTLLSSIESTLQEVAELTIETHGEKARRSVEDTLEYFQHFQQIALMSESHEIN